MTKKQIIQILFLIAFLYLGVYLLLIGFGYNMSLYQYDYGYDYYFSLISVLLLLTTYIIYSKKDCRAVVLLRFFLYLIILVAIFGRLFVYFSVYRYYPVSFSFDFLWKVFFKGFLSFFLSFNMLLAVLTFATLVLNKPLKFRIFKILGAKIKL